MRCFSIMSRTTAFCFFAAACLVCLGCGDKGPVRKLAEGLVPVTGTVTMNGKALGGGTIVFVPATKEMKNKLSTGNPAGEIDAEGGYELMWSSAQAGALPGRYQVVITYLEGEVSDDSDPTSLIPVKYGNPATSGFTAVVQEDGENNFDFDLTP